MNGARFKHVSVARKSIRISRWRLNLSFVVGQGALVTHANSPNLPNRLLRKAQRLSILD